MQRWNMIFAFGIIVFASSFGLSLIMEEVVYNSASDVNSFTENTDVTFVGTISYVGYEPGLGNLGSYIKIDGFDGYIKYDDNHFQIGEKVIVSGLLKVLPGMKVVRGSSLIKMADGSPPADITSQWWPSVSNTTRIIGIGIFMVGVIDFSIYRWKKGRTVIT